MKTRGARVSFIGGAMQVDKHGRGGVISTTVVAVLVVHWCFGATWLASCGVGKGLGQTRELGEASGELEEEYGNGGHGGARRGVARKNPEGKRRPGGRRRQGEAIVHA